MPTLIEQQDRTVSETISNGSGVQVVESVTNEAALLIERMELTEPMKIIYAPNHLLETKTYVKVGKNDLIHAKPSVIHFEGFEIGEKQVKSLRLLNASSDVLRMHIIPPQTRNFTISYTKPTRMVAGTAIECSVEFNPDEWRYYYDCIRIHCPGEENLIIPIHGYPVMSTKEFPRNYIFKPIPVGHRVSKTFPLKSLTPVDFEFNFKYIQSNPAFLLEPMSGIVPASGETEVTVTFAPCEFQTATMTVELTISQFNSKGILCTFTGTSQPGLLKEKTLLVTRSEVLDPKSVSPLDRARTNKQQTKAIRSGNKRKTLPGPAQTITLEKDGIRFPPVINNPHAVGKVLMQEPGKLRASELRQGMLAGGDMAAKDLTQKMKEAMFEQAVRQNVYEERQNQLRWQVKVGDDPLSAPERYRILEDRSEAMVHYMLKRKDPVPEDELRRQETTCTYRRTMRNFDQLAPDDATFDVYSNDLWAVRYAALERFVQAARTIIIRNRVDKRLPGLKSLVKNFKHKKDSGISEGDNQEKPPEETESAEFGSDVPAFTADKVQYYKFPHYISPNVKDDMAPDALGIVPVTPTQVVIKMDVSFLSLKVPQHYKLQGYTKHSTFDSSIGYMPVRHIRDLRTGAEDEIIRIPEDSFFPCPERSAGDNNVADAMVPRTAATSATTKRPASKVGYRELTPVQSHPVSLKPPGAFFRPIEYPSLQIMNPAPGLQVFLSPLPYSEIDYEYHLCPLPRYPHTDQAEKKFAVTQKRFLDREDTIRGVMSWKKFPSPGLVSMSNTPTLTSVWVPRWDNCFSKDLLPEDVPPLLNRLDPDDAENCVENGEESCTVCLLPEMVNTQFTLIDPRLQPDDQKVAGDMFPYGNRLPRSNIPAGIHGPVTKEKREEELEYFITKKYNRLGEKVNGKISELNAKVIDQGLVLK